MEVSIESFMAYFNEQFVFLAYQGNDTGTEGGARYLCNHRRAYKFFTDSISPKCHFTSFPCENYDKFQAGECFACGSGSATGKECGRLGYYSNQSKGRGSLFLLTRDEEPFCGKYSLFIECVYFYQQSIQNNCKKTVIEVPL